MSVDLTSYFNKYEALVAQADAAFDRVKTAHADCVECEEKCADCCHALFDLTLIEALYIHHRFNDKYQGSEKAELLEKSNRADRRIYKIKRKAYKELQAGKDYTQRADEADEYGDKGLVVALEDMVRDEMGHSEETERMLRDWPL